MVEQFKALRDAGVSQEMAFPRVEYEARLANVRNAMAEEDIDVLLVHHTPNFCYLAGYQTPLANWYACLIVPQEGELIAHIVDIELPSLLVHGWDNDSIIGFDWRLQGDAPGRLAEILRERGFAAERIGLELRLPGCSGQTAIELQQLLPEAKIIDASDLVLNLRVVKSPAELAHVREAARLTDIGMEASLDALAPGNTDNDVLAAAYAAMVRAGSEYVSIQPLVKVGNATGMVHITAKRRAMRPGDTVAIELTGVYQRYSAPLFRTGVIGQPSDLVRRLADHSLSTLALLLENARPGRPASEVAAAVARGSQPLEPPARGSEIGYGYAVGLSFPPDFVEHSMWIDENHDRPLEEGMVFHSVFHGRVPGKVAVITSECWTVTATGAEPLSKLRRDLTVVSA